MRLLSWYDRTVDWPVTVVPRRWLPLQACMLLHQLGPVPPWTGEVPTRRHRPVPVHARNLCLRNNEQQQTRPLRMEWRINGILEGNVSLLIHLILEGNVSLLVHLMRWLLTVNFYFNMVGLYALQPKTACFPGGHVGYNISQYKFT